MTWTWRLTMLAALLSAAAVASVVWVLNAGPVDHWLGVHTGATNEPGRTTDSGPGLVLI
jgi:hypothetical protein